MIELRSSFRGSVDVSASADAAYTLVCDVVDSSRHVSGLESVNEHGDGWRWITRKVGAGKVSLYVDYVIRYSRDDAKRVLTWTPVPEVGNSTLNGSWTVSETSGGARLALENNLVLSIGVPRLLRKPAEALFARENKRILEGYLQNLKLTLDGGNGRRR